MNTMNTFIKMFSIDFIPILHLKRGDARRSRRGAVVPVYHTSVDCNALTPLLRFVVELYNLFLLLTRLTCILRRTVRLR